VKSVKRITVLLHALIADAMIADAEVLR